MAYVDLVRPSLEAHSGVVDVVQRGLWFLANPAACADNKVPLMTCIDLVRPALVAHSGVADVVQRGLLFLASLALHMDSKVPLMAYVDLVRPALVAHSGWRMWCCTGCCFLPTWQRMRTTQCC